MTKILLVLSLLSPSLSAFSACREASAEVNAKWVQPAVKLNGAAAKGEAPLLPLDTKVELTLAKKADSFGGLVKLSAVNGGSYEVALGDRVWINVVDAGTGTSLKPGKFKKGEASKGAMKTIAFPLQAGRLYFLEVSKAASPLLAMLVHPAGQ